MTAPEMPADVVRRAHTMLAARGSGFAKLSKIAGFDPREHWCGANLRDVDFGADDLTGFMFHNADLTNANLSRARGLRAAMFKDAVFDETTKWPPGWQNGKVDWADDWGVDEYGSWASFTIKPKRLIPVVTQGLPVTQRLRWIPPGRFSMGSPPREPGRFDHEGPRHLVRLADGFWLFDTPCTQALWQAVMGRNPSKFKGPTRPVERVSFSDVQKFIQRLNELRLNLRLGLPSEAQWEYACRAGTETATYAGAMVVGDDGKAPVLEAVAWCAGNSDSTTHPVGEKRANDWGLHDMLGNVWEWCADHWHSNYQGAPADGRAWIEAGGAAYRVLRGGSWYGHERYVRSACRIHFDPSFRVDYLGFRCARVLSDSGSGAAVTGGEEPAEGAERPAATTSPARTRSGGRGTPKRPA